MDKLRCFWSLGVIVILVTLSHNRIAAQSNVSNVIEIKSIEQVAKELYPELFSPRNKSETDLEYSQRVVQQKEMLKELRADPKIIKERLVAIKAAEKERQRKIVNTESPAHTKLVPKSQDQYSFATLILRDGTRHRGNITKQDITIIHLKTKYGDLVIPTEEVLTIDYGLDDIYPGFLDSIVRDKEVSRAELKTRSKGKKSDLSPHRDSEVAGGNSPSPETRPNVKFIAYDEAPQPIGGFASIQRNLVYPEIAREAGIEGQVIIQAYVDDVGRVQEINVLRSIPNTGLDEAAAAAVRKTRFNPAKKGGKPVGVWISIPINFKLKG